MQAYKLKGKVDTAGNLVITEPVNMPPGDVEVIILQSVLAPENSIVPETELQPEVSKKKLQSKVKSLRELLENAPPIPPDFDPDQARIVLQTVEIDHATVPETESQPETPERRTKIKAFQNWFEKTQPVSPDFDAEQARWEALKEKHNL
jgi:hypothetical protein